MDEYIEKIKYSTKYPVSFLNSSLKSKENFVKKVTSNLNVVNVINMDDYLAVNEALIKMSQSLIESHGYVSYDGIKEGSYFNTNLVSDVITGCFFQGVQIKTFDNNIYKPERLQMALSFLENIFTLRIKCLTAPMPISSHKPMFKVQADSILNKATLEYLLSYRFYKNDFNISAQLICLTDLSQILDLFKQIAQDQDNAYSYDYLVNLFLRFFLDFYYD